LPFSITIAPIAKRTPPPSIPWSLHPHAHQTYKPLLVELCLTLPAPLSALLPLLPKLMRPLVTALK